MVEGKILAKRGDGALAPHLWVIASIYVANCVVYELFMWRVHSLLMFGSMHVFLFISVLNHGF